MSYPAAVVKLVALYRRPRDPQAWMQEFFSVFEPQLQDLPGLDRLELSQPQDVFSGGDRRGAPFLMVELYFADRATLDRAILAPEGEAIRERLIDSPGRDVSLFVADVR
jgi:uncharacterized protein (TIGR02118 family)